MSSSGMTVQHALLHFSNAEKYALSQITCAQLWESLLSVNIAAVSNKRAVYNTVTVNTAVFF